MQRIWGDALPSQTLVGVAALALPEMLFEVDAVARRTIEDWVADNADLVPLSPPPATPMAFVRVLTGEPSESLAHRVRREADVLVAPGAFFDVDDHLRIGHGSDPVQLRAGLDRLSAVLRS